MANQQTFSPIHSGREGLNHREEGGIPSASRQATIGNWRKLLDPTDSLCPHNNSLRGSGLGIDSHTGKATGPIIIGQYAEYAIV